MADPSVLVVAQLDLGKDLAISRDLEDCGCAYVTQHDRELGRQSVMWTLAHTNEHAKELMRMPFDLRFELVPALSDEDVQTLLTLTERYCVVYQTISKGVPVTITHTSPAP